MLNLQEAKALVKSNNLDIQKYLDSPEANPILDSTANLESKPESKYHKHGRYKLYLALKLMRS